MKWPALIAFTLVVVTSTIATAQVLFQSDLSTDEGFVVVAGQDNAYLFGYDYHRFESIPEAPNSAALEGEPFQGLRMAANLTQSIASGIAAVTDGLHLSGRFAVQVDLWLNYNIPDGTTGTTEFGGLSIGHDQATAGLSGASLIYDTDGESGSDYRLYRHQEFQTQDTGGYALPSLDNAAEPLVSAFPAIDVEAAVPGQFIRGTTRPGTGGFRWMVVEAEVDTQAIGIGTTTDRGVAKFSLTDAQTGNRVPIGAIDNSSGATVVDLTGDVGLLFLDLFSSVSATPDLSFGVFDNLIITQLEPAFSPLDCSQDGAVDATDLQCVTKEFLAPMLAQLGLLAGDFDANGAVAFSDFIRLSGNFGKDVSSYVAGDADLNGSVGFTDFIILSGNFGKVAAATAAVPEPAPWVPVAGALFATTCWFRRSQRRRAA